MKKTKNDCEECKKRKKNSIILIRYFYNLSLSIILAYFSIATWYASAIFLQVWNETHNQIAGMVAIVLWAIVFLLGGLSAVIVASTFIDEKKERMGV